MVMCSYNKTKVCISFRDIKFQRFVPLKLEDKLKRACSLEIKKKKKKKIKRWYKWFHLYLLLSYLSDLSKLLL